MDMDFNISQRMKQTQVLSQQARMGIHILQLPLMELRTYIDQEMTENPLLEDTSDLDDDHQDDIDTYENMADEYYEGSQSSVYDPDRDKKRLFREVSITKEESLEDHLLWQLGIYFSGKEYNAGEFIICNLDENGYFRMPLQSVDNRYNIGLDRLKDILSAIQCFDPVGVAAANVKECLMIQLKVRGKESSAAYRIVSKCLDDLSRKKYSLIARKVSASLEEVEAAHAEISALEPKPGRAYSTERAVKIIPDLILKKDGENFVIELNRGYIPSLKMNNYYVSLYKQGKLDKETKRYIKQRRERAKCLIGALEQSQDTIRRIASFIVDYQKDFLELGEGNIKPLKLTDVAEKLQVNESTVSRAIANKYLQTHFGVIPLKRFFSTALKQQDGTSLSSEAIQSAIRELVDNEDQSKPLSDQRLVELLKERNIDVARRTVTKYRKNMKILSSSLRK